jgi:hypothetical protein
MENSVTQKTNARTLSLEDFSPYAPPCNTVRRKLRGLIFALRRRLSPLGVLAQIALSEWGTLIPRILWRMQTKADFGMSVGAKYQKHPAGYLVLNTRTSARIQDMQYMQAKYQWATSVDLALFLEGWDKGEEWQLEVGNSCKRPCPE